MPNQALGYRQKVAFRLLGYSGTSGGLPTLPYPAALGTPTPQDLGAYSLLAALSEEIADNEGHLEEEILDGNAGLSQIDLISRLPSGGLQLSAMYGTLDQLLAAALGYEKVRTTAVLESPAVTSIVTSTATGGSSTTLVKTAAGWTANAYEGMFVRMEKLAASVNAVKEVRRIVSNDATTLTVTPAWTTNPVNTDPFTIFAAATHTFECAKNLHIESVVSATPWDSASWLCRLGVLGVSISPHGVREYQACMINKLKLKLSAKDGLTITLELIPFAYDLRTSARNFDPSSWTKNPVLALASVAGAAANTMRPFRRALFKDAVFRLGSYSVSALGSTDILGLSEFELEIDNGLDSESQDTTSGIHRIEPVRAKKRTVKGSITLPRFNSLDRVNALRAETYQKADLVFTGPSMFLAGPSGTHSLSIFLPKIKLLQPSAPVAGQSPLTEKIEFQCLQPELTVSGMPTPSSGADNSEVFIRTTSPYPFNDFMGQQTTS